MCASLAQGVDCVAQADGFFRAEVKDVAGFVSRPESRFEKTALKGRCFITGRGFVRSNQRSPCLRVSIVPHGGAFRSRSRRRLKGALSFFYAFFFSVVEAI